jgi:hypothetical protein
VQGGSSAIAGYATEKGYSTAHATATLLYNLGKQAQKGVPVKHKRAVSAAVAVLTDQLTAPQHSSTTQSAAHSQPQSLLTQLDPLQFALCAWATSQLHQHADVRRLCGAIMQHAVHSNILEQGSWKNWSRLLYGLASSRIRCDTSRELQHLFDRAVSHLTPSLAEQNQQCSSQDVSNIPLCCSKGRSEG